MDGTTAYEIPHADVFFEIIEPKELAYTYKIRPAQDFGTTFNETFAVRNVPLVPTDPSHACDKLINSAQLKKNIALVERGSVFWSVTVKSALQPLSKLLFSFSVSVVSWQRV